MAPGSAVRRSRRVQLRPGHEAWHCSDTDGVYTRYLDSLGADAALIRPNFVLFGSAQAHGVMELAQMLVDRLQGAAQPKRAAQLITA